MTAAPSWTRTAPDGYTVAARDGAPRHTWSFVVDDLPATTGAGSESWLVPLLRLDGGTVRVALVVAPVSDGAAALWLTLQETGHEATARTREARGWTRDRRVDHALADAERIQEEFAAGVGRVVRLGVSITLEAPTPPALDDLKARAIALLERRRLVWRDLHWRHDLGFRQTMVDGPRALWCPQPTNTSTVAYSWPAAGSTVSMPAGPFWGVGAASAAPVLYDVYAQDQGVPAPHVALLGNTGHGKSTAFAHLLAEYLTQPRPPEAIVIDPKGDYRRLCAALGGQRVAFSAAPAQTINVMDLPPLPDGPPLPGGSGGENPVHEAALNVVGFLQLACGQQTPLTDEETAQAQMAALRAYADERGGRKPIKPDDPGTWRYPAPTLGRLHAALLERPATRSLANRLEPYAVGPLSALFGRPTTLDAANPLVVFDLVDLRDQLRPVAVFLIGTHTWHRARRVPARRVFGMDEVPALLAHPATARLVGDMCAMGRSFGLSVWLLGQSRADFEQNAEGRRALEKCHTRLTLTGVGAGVLDTPRGRVALRILPTPEVQSWLPQPVRSGAEAAATGLQAAASSRRRLTPSHTFP